jgi:LuxR family maltose regulon positive regulatory protein
MIASILSTKLYIPLPQTKVVLRRRLIDRLNEGLQGKLSLICTPAGFGKTTLVSEWVTASRESPERAVAWLSLDEGDNDSTRFLAFLVAALQTIAPDMGIGLLAVLHRPSHRQLNRC